MALLPDQALSFVTALCKKKVACALGCIVWGSEQGGLGYTGALEDLCAYKWGVVLKHHTEQGGSRLPSS